MKKMLLWILGKRKSSLKYNLFLPEALDIASKREKILYLRLTDISKGDNYESCGIG